MNNRNLLIFVVASMALTFGYMKVIDKFYPSQPQAAAAKPAETSASPAPQTPAAAPVPAPPVAPAVPQAPPALAPRFHTVSLSQLRVTFRVEDGAMVQVEWLKDGTKFFPEKAAEKHVGDFPGLGGVLGATFDKVSEEKAGDVVAVHFENAAHDLLTYRIPDRGHIVDVAWSTKQGHPLSLVRLPQGETPEKALEPVAPLGRVYTLEEKDIHAVTWTDMLQDPFFSFVGAKRKELPKATTWVGMDAGLNKGQDLQTTWYFAAIWDVSRMPDRAMTGRAGYSAAPDANGKLSARLYLGPKETKDLAAFGPAFAQVVDYGFFGTIAKLLFIFLRAIHAVLGNWGWAILVFSILLRLALWPFNTKTTINMLRMKELEPHQKAIQAKYEKFGSDMAKKAEMQKELMDFYKKNGHNPFGGCAPMLLQMPVFLALWSMLNNVFELRHAPWIFWIHDLSAKDPYFVLPVLLGASMFAQQFSSPPMGDPTQRKMMLVLMPAMMTFFFAQSPAGLGLYYLIFNLVSVFQTWWIKRSYVPQPVKV